MSDCDTGTYVTPSGCVMQIGSSTWYWVWYGAAAALSAVFGFLAVRIGLIGAPTGRGTAATLAGTAIALFGYAVYSMYALQNAQTSSAAGAFEGS